MTTIYRDKDGKKIRTETGTRPRGAPAPAPKPPKPEPATSPTEPQAAVRGQPKE